MTKTSDFKEPPNSYWIVSTPDTDFPSLDQNIEVDVAIVGGGLVGITCAHLLSNQGFKVALLEADHLFRGTTGHSTAKITSQHSLIYAQLINQVGQELAEQYAQANEKAIHFIHDTARENQIDCDFEWRPAFIFTQSEQYLKQLEDENRAAADLGIKSAFLDNLPLPFPVKAALRFDGQAQFHPLKYCHGLLNGLPDSCRIYERTQAVDIEAQAKPRVITASGHKVEASQVIIATHYPFFDGKGFYFTRVWASRSYIIGITAQEKLAPGTYISAETPTRSLRSTPLPEDELILVAGEEHKTGQSKLHTNQHYQNLIDFAHHVFQVNDIPYRWSAQDYLTIDGLPYIGNLRAQTPHIYVATGFAKWGISNGTAAALVLADLIKTGTSPWQEVFDPARPAKPRAIYNFVVQNANVAVQYISGKLRSAIDAEDIPINEARVIQMEDDKVGAFRDDQGKLHVVDLTCPHLGCELQWNHAELSWDCPCHGSRFTYQGDIMEGPALTPLHNACDIPNQVEPNIF